MLLAASAAVRAEAGDSLRSVDALQVVAPPALLPLLAVLLLLLQLLLLLLLSLPHNGESAAAAAAAVAPAAAASPCRRIKSAWALWYAANAALCSVATAFLSTIAVLRMSM